MYGSKKILREIQKYVDLPTRAEKKSVDGHYTFDGVKGFDIEF